MSKRSTHHIRVETDEENVTVMIGGDGGVPGGFAKFFNRVIDCLAWARLPDAAKSAYMVLVRFADHKDQFRVAVGQASLMKYSGLSRSSIKRAIKDLVASKLLILVEQGGVTPDGQNECSLYQLMVPSDPKARTRVVSSDAQLAPTGRVEPVPPGVRTRTPSRFTVEPPPGVSADPGSVREQTRRGVQSDDGGGFAHGPQLRSIKEMEEDNSRRVAKDAVALLVEKGVERSAARELAESFSQERIVDVVATMEYRKARGKCDNPGGFIRDALLRQWQTPRPVIEARRQAEVRLRARAAEDKSRKQRLTENVRAGDDERRVQQVIDNLDEDELRILAESILKKYEGNAAVLQVLTRRPARECRLMKMEIAALVGQTC